MSGGKGSGKQSRDTVAEDALVARPGATDPLLAAREGPTDAQIDALRQGLPHLTAPASLQDSRAGKQPAGTGTTEKGKQPAAQKRTRTTRHDTQTPPLLLAADAFASAPAAETECCTLWEPILQNTNEQGIWPADRTIMLRRTAKRFKEVVDKMRLPAVVCLSRSFWHDARYGTEEAKLQFVFRQLAAMTARCLVTTLELPDCAMKGQDTERLAGVLAQCPALAHLDLSGNSCFGAAGAERLAGVLAQCRELVHLNLSGNYIGAGGAERLAGVLAQCPALAHLNLSDNQIGAGGAESLAGVLGQCTALAHLNLWNNQIGPGGAERLAGVLPQCPALAHLDLYGNWIGAAGAERLAGVLPQCAALAHLNLFANAIGTVGEGRLRASWCGQASGLLL